MPLPASAGLRFNPGAGRTETALPPVQIGEGLGSGNAIGSLPLGFPWGRGLCGPRGFTRACRWLLAVRVSRTIHGRLLGSGVQVRTAKRPSIGASLWAGTCARRGAKPRSALRLVPRLGDVWLSLGLPGGARGGFHAVSYLSS
jgi:hypothetical protein